MDLSMSKRSDEIETEPHRLDDGPVGPRNQAGGRTFAGTVADFFRKGIGTNTQEATVADARPIGQPSTAALSVRARAKSTLYEHWDAIRADGITASEFIAFLQPLADLDGITVSYIYSDADGTEHVYNHKRGEFGIENPLSRAIQEKKLSKEKALSFALNEEGRVWIESNFMELSDLK
jgi:hypothetical protein